MVMFFPQVIAAKVEKYVSDFIQETKQLKLDIIQLDKDIRANKKDKQKVSSLKLQKTEKKKRLNKIKKLDRQAKKDFKQKQKKKRAEATWAKYPGPKKLCAAVKYNRLDLVKQVIEKESVDVNTQTFDCQYALGIAAKKGNIEIADYLIKHQANLVIEAAFGIQISALEMAAKSKKNNVAMINYLISKGASPHDGDGDSMPSAMIRSASSGQEKNLKKQHNIKAEQLGAGGVLNKVITAGHLKNIKALLDNGANPNGFMLASSVLMEAAKRFQLDRIKLLVENGADVNLEGPSYQTVLMRIEKQRVSNKRNKAKKQAVIDYLKSKGAK